MRTAARNISRSRRGTKRQPPSRTAKQARVGKPVREVTEEKPICAVHAICIYAYIYIYIYNFFSDGTHTYIHTYMHTYISTDM